LNRPGKHPSVNDRLARCATKGAKTYLHLFRTVVGRKSMGKDFAGMDSINLYASSVVTGVKRFSG